MAIRKALIACRERTVNWLWNGKQIIVLLFLCMLANYAVTPLKRLAQVSGQPMQLWEPFLSAANSKYLFSGILCGFLVLCSDYNSMDNAKKYLIHRTGKKVWFAGNILFGAVSAVIYLFEVAVVFTVWGCSTAYVENGWSLLMRNYDSAYSQMGRQMGVICMVSERIFHHFTPRGAMIANLLSIVGILLMLHFIIIITGMIGHMQAGMLVDGVVILSGLMLIWVNHPLQNFHPLGKALLYTLNEQVLKSESILSVYIYDIVINLVIIAVGAIWFCYLKKGIEKT